MFERVLGTSMLWKASDRGIVEYSYLNLREYGLGPRKQVDDTPYGGGSGMVMRVDVLVATMESLPTSRALKTTLPFATCPRTRLRMRMRPVRVSRKWVMRKIK